MAPAKARDDVVAAGGISSNAPWKILIHVAVGSRSRRLAAMLRKRGQSGSGREDEAIAG